MMSARYLLSLRNVEDLLQERGIDITYETVLFWSSRIATIFPPEIRRNRFRRCATFGNGAGTSTRCS